MAEIDFDAIDRELQSEKSSENSNGQKKKVNPVEIVYRLEKTLFSMLDRVHENIKPGDDEIRLNAELLGAYIEENISVDMTPGKLFLAHSALMAAGVLNRLDHEKKKAAPVVKKPAGNEEK